MRYNYPSAKFEVRLLSKAACRTSRKDVDSIDVQVRPAIFPSEDCRVTTDLQILTCHGPPPD